MAELILGDMLEADQCDAPSRADALPLVLEDFATTAQVQCIVPVVPRHHVLEAVADPGVASGIVIFPVAHRLLLQLLPQLAVKGMAP